MPDHRSLVRVPLLVQSPLNRYRGLEHERRERHQDVTLTSGGNDGVASNLAAVLGPITPSGFFDIAGGFFGDQEYAVTVESETASIVEEHLRASGWTLDEDEVAMILTWIPEQPPAPEDLAIERVTSRRAYEDFMRVVPGNRDWVPSLAAATDPDVGLFVGYAGGRPVVTSRLACYRAIGEVTAVQTLESHRRRGYGRALTWAAITEAGRRGCTAVILTATEMGYPLYLGMGFEEVCSYRTYLPPVRPEQHAE